MTLTQKQSPWVSSFTWAISQLSGPDFVIRPDQETPSQIEFGSAQRGRIATFSLSEIKLKWASSPTVFEITQLGLFFEAVRDSAEKMGLYQGVLRSVKTFDEYPHQSLVLRFQTLHNAVDRLSSYANFTPTPKDLVDTKQIDLKALLNQTKFPKSWSIKTQAGRDGASILLLNSVKTVVAEVSFSVRVLSSSGILMLNLRQVVHHNTAFKYGFDSIAHFLTLGISTPKTTVQPKIVSQSQEFDTPNFILRKSTVLKYPSSLPVGDILPDALGGGYNSLSKELAHQTVKHGFPMYYFK